MGALNDFQTALYLHLTSDATLIGLTKGASHIGDWPKPSGPFPWVTIGEDAEGQWGMKDQTANFKIKPTIHVWSKSRGWKQANQILDRIDVLLLTNQLQLDGSSSFTIIAKGQRPDATVKLPGDDKGNIRHIVAEYIFWLSV